MYEADFADFTSIAFAGLHARTRARTHAAPYPCCKQSALARA